MSSPKSPLFTGLWEWATLGSNRPNFPLCNNRVFQNYHFSWGLRVGDSKIDLIFHCTTIGLSKISTFCWAPGVGYSKINLILHCTTMFLGDVCEHLINPELRTSKASLCPGSGLLQKHNYLSGHKVLFPNKHPSPTRLSPANYLGVKLWYSIVLLV